MTEQRPPIWPDVPDERWGDSEAQFPYCLTKDEYVALIVETATRGLDPIQYLGLACVRCLDALDPGAKVGVLKLTYRTHEGEFEQVAHELRACLDCESVFHCPTWCDREHEPLIPDHEYLGEDAIHQTQVGTVGDEEVTVVQHEDAEDGLRAPYAHLYGTDLELDPPRTRQLAAVFLNAADKLDEITGGAS